MDPQFQELAAQISREVAENVSRSVTANVTKSVTESVTKSVTENVTKSVIENVTKSVTENVTKSVTDTVAGTVTRAVVQNVNAHVSEVVFAAEKRLAHQARINAEALKTEARMVADNYGGVLQSIDSRLSRLESDLGKQFALRDLVLTNHNERITALEDDRST